METPPCFEPLCNSCPFKGVCAQSWATTKTSLPIVKKRAGKFDKKEYMREYYKTYKRKKQPAGRSTGDVEHEKLCKAVEKLEKIDKKRRKLGDVNLDEVQPDVERERA